MVKRKQLTKYVYGHDGQVIDIAVASVPDLVSLLASGSTTLETGADAVFSLVGSLTKRLLWILIPFAIVAAILLFAFRFIVRTLGLSSFIQGVAPKQVSLVGV